MTDTLRTVLFRSASIFTALLTASAAFAAPVYLKPGQCVQIGSQEVCAMQTDATTGKVVTAANDVVHICTYDLHKGAEIPNLKNYAVIRVVTTPDGYKTETILKQFGISDPDKANCDAEVARLNGAKP